MEQIPDAPQTCSRRVVERRWTGGLMEGQGPEEEVGLVTKAEQGTRVEQAEWGTRAVLAE